MIESPCSVVKSYTTNPFSSTSASIEAHACITYRLMIYRCIKCARLTKGESETEHHDVSYSRCLFACGKKPCKYQSIYQLDVLILICLCTYVEALH